MEKERERGGGVMRICTLESVFISKETETQLYTYNNIMLAYLALSNQREKNPCSSFNLHVKLIRYNERRM